ncbi:hypothetical protein P692DRAFT_20138557 [Suillus brevipes Sb2]|nr:hypothetical protein P692DRAFT_20138557 [Suillus brevipes Sb2]
MHIRGHSLAPVSSMGIAEINDAKAAMMIAEEKRIVCDLCDIESTFALCG